MFSTQLIALILSLFVVEIYCTDCKLGGKVIKNKGFTLNHDCSAQLRCYSGNLVKVAYEHSCPDNSDCVSGEYRCKCREGFAPEEFFSILIKCHGPTTIAAPTQPPTTAAAIQPNTTVAPTQPPTTVAPIQPNTTVAPTQPPTTVAPTQAPTTAAPKQPNTTVAPTQALKTAAPTQPNTTVAPTQPPTTFAPTQPPTTAAPTQPPTTNAPTQRHTTAQPHIPTTESTVCPSTWTPLHNNTCVKAFPKNKKTWADARSFCMDNYEGDLVRVDNAETTKVITGILAKPLPYWIGIHDPSKNGGWQYTDGLSLNSYKPWAYKEPNKHGGNEFCVEMKSNRRGSWNDKRCSRKRPFVCQKTLH